MASGYKGKLLYVDLSNSKVYTKTLEEERVKNYLSGSGLGIKIVSDLVKEKIDAFSEVNPLLFMPGLLTGCFVPTANRTAVCAHSPLTGVFGEARAGGFWGAELKFAGYDGIVIQGKAKKPIYIWIKNDSVEIRPAQHLWGKGFYETTNLVLAETQGEAKIGAIGPAGENLSRFACVMFDGRFARSAGRTGLGAVMGSKNLKAIAVRGTGSLKVANLEGLRQKMLKFVKEDRPHFKERAFVNGTAGTIMATEAVGDMPIKGWLGGRWTEKAEKICGETIKKNLEIKEASCYSCPINCTIIAETKTPPYTGIFGHAPEYETLAMFGSLLDNDNLESIFKLNEICNDYSLDTISAGSLCAFAIEAFERGYLTTKDTEGIVLRWGEPEAIIKLLYKIARREDIGDILAEGVREAAKKLGNKFQEMAVEVKGLELPAHDPRAFYSNALHYAVCNRGSCHVDGLSFAVEGGLPMPDFGYTERMDPFTTEGKALLAMRMEHLMTIYDALGLCKFLFIASIGPQRLSQWLNDCTGWDFTAEELEKLGEKLFNLKRMYSVKMGITAKDDYLPERILKVPQRDDIPPVPPEKLQIMKEEYYRLRGWDENGIPKEEKLKELGLI